jgi:capsular polysaccharide biosynthesis protein
MIFLRTFVEYTILMSDNRIIVTENSEDAISLVQLIRIIAKKKWLFILAYILCCGAGLFAVKFIKPKYESSMFISTVIKDGKQIDRVIDYIEKARKMGNRRVLAAQMGISLADASALESIEVKDPQGDNPNTFSGEVKFESARKEAIEPLAKGIIHVIENNEFLKSKADMMSQEVMTLLHATDEEIAVVKKQMDAAPTYNMELHNSYLALVQRRANIVDHLSEIKVVEVVDGPVIPTGPSGIAPGLMNAIVFIVALFGAAFIVVFIEAFQRGMKSAA